MNAADPILVAFGLLLTKAGGQSYTTLALDAPVHANRALAVDRDGVPHIAFGGSGQLLHGFWNGSAFQYTPVNTTPGVYSYAAIAVDQAGGRRLDPGAQMAGEVARHELGALRPGRAARLRARP